MAEENFQERTEKATPRRREKARERGQVTKSMELNSAIIVCGGVTMLFALGPFVGSRSLEIMRYTMANAPCLATIDPTFYSLFVNNLMHFFVILLPVFGIMVVMGLAVNIAQVGFRVTPKAMEPKFEKLNLVSGLKRLVSVRSLVMMVRDSLKLALIAFIAYKAITSEFDHFFLLPDMSVVQLAHTMGKMALWVALKLGAAMFVLAVLDYAYHKYDYEKNLRMSRQEIKDEHKDTEGSPEIKSRVRQVKREMARRRMIAEVPNAHVVITNPTHLAVALKYQPDNMDAPQVIAKGQRLIARKIKEIAREHNIPVVEDKPLARALYKMCDIGQLVPQSLYRAVAEVLAYVYRLKGQGVEHA